MRQFLLLVLLFLVAPLNVQADVDVGKRLRALASKDETVQKAALASWQALPKQARVELLRRVLRSKDVELATIAASAQDVRMLDHGKIKRVCRLLLSDPFMPIESDQRPSWGFKSRDAVGREDLLPLLATLHHGRPEQVRALLKRWVETQPTYRRDVLVQLVRLGDTLCIEEMLERWSRWYQEQTRFLGRVSDERVQAFVFDQAASGDVAERM